MTKVVDAIYTNGHLEPVEPLDLAEEQRVRLTIELAETVEEGLPEMEPTATGREAALRELFEQIEKMDFCSTGPYPTRDELHERG